MTTQPSDWAVVDYRNGRLPCPFCGGDTQHVYMNHADDPHYRVVCMNQSCQAQGPRGPIMSDRDAVLWNTRTPVARELDASGGGVEPAGYFDPDVMAHLADGNIDPVGVLRRKPNGFSTVPIYLTPRAAEAGEWLPIESAPDDIGLCVVYTPDQGDGERFDIDWKEDGVWQEHYNHFEHFMAVGGANACGPDVVCTGPGEEPEYTHYRRLTPPRAAMGAVGAGDS